MREDGKQIAQGVQDKAPLLDMTGICSTAGLYIGIGLGVVGLGLGFGLTAIGRGLSNRTTTTTTTMARRVRRRVITK